MHFDGGLKLSIAQHSSAGQKPVNEDSLGIRVPENDQITTKGAVAIIADGVSAAEAGKEAAETCVTGFLSDYFSTPDSWSVKRSAQQVLTALNRWLYGQGQHYIQAEKGYVSTLSIAIFKSQTAHIFHVGDSRVYRLREGILEQLTRDHAMPVGRGKSYLTRAMGLDVNLDVDYRAADVAVGDVFVLSTDGIHDVLSSSRMQALIAAHGDELDVAGQCLIDEALAAGSDDNLSCQLLRIDALPLADAGDVYRKLTVLPFPPPLSVGVVVDGLLVEAEIHASPRSQLYKVFDQLADRRYVMKTPSPNFNDDPAYIERFILESWIGRRIQSDYVIEVIEPPKTPSYLYYLSDYSPGSTLGEWMQKHPKPATQAMLDIILPVAKGLQAMHRRDTFHQDIKPDNILVGDDGSVKIIDFGSCYVAGLAEIAVPIERDKVLGTAQYSAPEHILGRRPSGRADQFSLAVIVFEMLTGQLPYQGRLQNCATTIAFSRLKYVSACAYNAHVPLWLDASLARALSISPELRYSDVSEFVYDLANPNPDFMRDTFQPLLIRNPLRTWQGISLFLFACLLWSLLR
ncbi:protein kinase domain-containing protein [Zhongshania sp.]|jgi:serine/threonine protein kinase|uniref:protein kinase domain-containing protein n=1 Tax=Zhongshania sp. TaxID=1971902 RepID=UPI0039E68597